MIPIRTDDELVEHKYSEFREGVIHGRFLLCLFFDATQTNLKFWVSIEKTRQLIYYSRKGWDGS